MAAAHAIEDVRAIEAAGPERTEALRKAKKLRNVADYNYLFSSELRPPE